MPISGGTAGAHDDNMHQGSAKRDVVDGVAGLDAAGRVLAPGNGIEFVRDGANLIKLRDQTSDETFLHAERIGVYDWHLFTRYGAAMPQIQNSDMKDVVSGIAALGAGGQLLAPGSDIELTRDGSENIEVVERTSGNIVFRWTRVGVNDFECRVNCGGVACKILNDSLIDAVNGIAGLDANTLLSPAVVYPVLEEYSNHLGATDNFTETATGGNGTAVEDAANHEMDLDTGVTVLGHAVFQTKETYILSTNISIVNIIIDNMQQSVAGVSKMFLGLMADFTVITAAPWALFEEDHLGNWKTWTHTGAASTSTVISSVSDGDILTIVASTSKVCFFVNGSIVATHTTNIPTGAMHAGGSVLSYTSVPTTSRGVSVDYIGVKRYK